MPRNGTDGTYSVAFTAVAGTTILASDYNTQETDVATALTNSIAKDGQTVPNANLPMGTQRHTNVGAAVARTDYARADQVQDGAFVWGGTAGGTADAHEVTLSPATATYTAGRRIIYISPAAANTGAVTVEVDSIATPQALKSIDGYDLGPGDIPPSSVVDIIYDGTDFRLARHIPPRRNLIINGGMTIDQRNSGAAITPTGSVLTVDRWGLSVSTASKITVQQITTGLPPGASHAAKLTVAAGYTAGASDFFVFQHNIEGIDVAELGWGATGALPLALSFDFYSSATGTFAIAIVNPPSAARSYVATFDVDSAATWQRVSLVIPGDTTGTWPKTAGVAGLAIRLDLGTGSNFEGAADEWAAANYTRTSGSIDWVATTGREIRLTDVKAEVATPTAFVHEDVATALARCQRFYQSGILVRYDGPATSGTTQSHTQPFVVRMAKTPALTFSGESVFAFPSGTPTTTFTDAATLFAHKIANATGPALFHYVAAADAEI